MSLNNEPQMDRNYWVAIVLSMFIIFGYYFYLQKTAPAQKSQPQTLENPTHSEAKDILQENALKKPEGPFLETPISQTVVQFENALYKAELSSYGGTIKSLVYKGENEKSGIQDIVFYQAQELEPGLFSSKVSHDSVDLSRSLFRLTKQTEDSFEFTYEKAGDYRFKKTIYFSSDEPIIGVDVEIENLSDRARNIPLEFIYGLHTSDIEPSDHPMVEAVVKGDGLKEANYGKLAKKNFVVSEQIQWAGIIRKYFALLVKPDAKAVVQDARMRDGRVTAALTLEPFSVAPQSGEKKQFFIYAGPQRYEVLKSFDMGFEDVLARGFFGVFKIALLRTLKFLDTFTHNYGWAIILLTLILKGLFAPLTHMSFESMKKMQALQPKMKSLQEHYKNDPQKLNQKMMELYRKNKVNPMSGCLPMLLQIPIFIAFYQMLSGAIELKGAPFIFWITDLAAPDRLFSFPFKIPFIGDSFHLLPILMLLSMVVQQRMTPQMGTTPEQAKMMNIMMPAMFGFMFYNMPSGLVLYWFVNNLLTIIHQGVVKRAAVALHLDEHD